MARKKKKKPSLCFQKEHPDKIHQAEDLTLKSASAIFGVDLLNCLDVSQSASSVMPTETIYLEVRHMYEDFNFMTDDGSWLHFEFESDALTLDDLKRFREYEAAISRTYKVPVTTYVLCSSDSKNIKTSFREGINTYRIKLIRLKRKSADLVFRRIQKKQNKGEALTKSDLLPVLLTPLMSGKLSLPERFLKGFQILKAAEADLERETLMQLQSLLYVFAGKFLDRNDLEKVKEVISMTILGELLMNDGIKKGIKEGIKEGIEQGEQKVNRLIQLLIENSRSDEISRAVTDRDFQEQLFKEFSL